MVPVRVVIPTVGLLLLQLVIECHERAGGARAAARPGRIANPQSRKAETAGLSDSSAGPSQVKEYGILGMIALLPVLIYLFGFILSAALYIWMYYRYYFRQPFVLSAALTAGTAAFFYVLFVLLLGSDIGYGVVWRF